MNDLPTYAEVSLAIRLEDGGTLRWIVTRGSAHAGDRAGRADRQGYLALHFKGRDLMAHRVVWLLTHGEWPTSMLDHIDGNRSNNDPSNLRQCTNSQNQQNRKAGNLGFKGVTWHRHAGRFQAQCARRYLGLFTTAEEAGRAYDKEARQVFGEFARLNFGSAS